MKKLYRKIFLVREIKSRKGEIHFRRWRLIETPWFNIYFHVFFKPDGDLDMHDHPWDFMTLILWNGYDEMISDHIVLKRNTFYQSFNKAEKKHRIVALHNSSKTYTFAVTGPRRREWGYHTPQGWVSNSDYRLRKTE